MTETAINASTVSGLICAVAALICAGLACVLSIGYRISDDAILALERVIRINHPTEPPIVIMIPRVHVLGLHCLLLRTVLVGVALLLVGVCAIAVARATRARKEHISMW